MYPAELRYTKDHEWARKAGDGTLTVGITDWGAKQLGDVVMVELVDAGAEIEAGEPFGTVESVKAVTEVFAPVSGTIATTNGELEAADPELVNTDSYGEGWMITLRPSDAKAFDGLMTAAQYEAYVASADD